MSNTRWLRPRPKRIKIRRPFACLPCSQRAQPSPSGRGQGEGSEVTFTSAVTGAGVRSSKTHQRSCRAFERRSVIDLAKCDAARGDPWLRAQLRLRKKPRPTPHPALSRWERVGGVDVSAGLSWAWTCHECASQMGFGCPHTSFGFLVSAYALPSPGGRGLAARTSAHNTRGFLDTPRTYESAECSHARTRNLCRSLRLS